MGRLPPDGPAQSERQLSRIGVSQAQPEHGAGDFGKVPSLDTTPRSAASLERSGKLVRQQRLVNCDHIESILAMISLCFRISSFCHLLFQCQSLGLGFLCSQLLQY